MVHLEDIRDIRNENSWPKPKTEIEENQGRKPKHRKKLLRQLLVPFRVAAVYGITGVTGVEANRVIFLFFFQ